MAQLLATNETDLDHAILAQVKACCQALYDKKAETISVLYMGSKSTIADYFVIATGTSDPHLRALTGAVEVALKSEGGEILGRDRAPGNGWMVVDAYDFMVHVFTAETRRHFNLEGLWKDARRVEVALT